MDDNIPPRAFQSFLVAAPPATVPQQELFQTSLAKLPRVERIDTQGHADVSTPKLPVQDLRNQALGAQMKQKKQESYRPTRTDIIAELGRWLRLVQPIALMRGKSQPRQMRAVYEALEPFGKPESVLPAGVTDLMILFLACTAAAGAWEALARQDQRIPPLLRDYYLTDTSFAEMGKLVGATSPVRAISPGRVSQLINAGIEFLWNRLSPDQQHRFPEGQLRRGRRGRGSKASREAAKARWQNAARETRLRWLERMDAAAHTENAEEKRRAKARARYVDSRPAPGSVHHR